jgi:hypothetical protein
MNEEVKQNIASVLQSVIEIFSSGTIISSDLKKLSNKLMKDMSLFHDKDTISVSILVYSLYKIFSKNAELEKLSLKKHLQDLLNHIDDETEFRSYMRDIYDHLKKYDKNVEYTIVQTIKHAQVKSGLNMYEYGISIGQAAEILGVSKWELMGYLGTTNIVDKDSTWRIDPKSRLHFARALFK